MPVGPSRPRTGDAPRIGRAAMVAPVTYSWSIDAPVRSATADPTRGVYSSDSVMSLRSNRDTTSRFTLPLAPVTGEIAVVLCPPGAQLPCGSTAQPASRFTLAFGTVTV